MAGVKISDLSTVTPLGTDLVALDRPTTGPGAPVTGKATLTAIQALIGGTGGGNDYWESTTSGEIFATGSLAAVTGSFLASFLSSSNGSEITGSLLINVEGPNDGHGLIISASTNNSSRALEIVDVANSATIFSVDHNTSKVKVDSITNPNQSIALNAVQGFGAGHIEIKVDTASSPTGSITVIDETSNFSNLNLEIAALEFNGEQGISGYVLTSSAPNAPGWALVSSLLPVYWQSNVAGTAYTTGSIEATFISGSAGLKVSSSNTEFAFDYNYSNGLSLSDFNSLDEVILTTGSLSYINGTSPTGFSVASAGNISLNATSDLFVTATIGKMYVAPKAVFDAGLSGSLTQLADGSSYLIAGANVTISTGTNGAVTISSTGGGGSQYWNSITSGNIFTTGSASSLYLSASSGAEITGTLGVNGTVITKGTTIVDGGTKAGQVFEDTDTSGNSYGLVVKNSGAGYGTPFLSFVQGSTVASGYVGGIVGWASSPAYGNIEGINLVPAASYPNIGFRMGSSNIARFNASGLQVTGSIATDTVHAATGISGSLTKLANGTSYLIAGTNVTISTGTNGAVTISSTGGGVDQFWFSTINEAVYTTGSALFSGPGGVGVDSPALLGTDMFFFVSGAIGSKDTAVTGTAVFGGDVHMSGNLSTDGNATVSQFISIGQNLQVVGLMGVTGSAEFLGGVTGSISYTPGNGAYWADPDPTNVKDALDRIASLLYTLNSSTPIP